MNCLGFSVERLDASMRVAVGNMDDPMLVSVGNLIEPMRVAVALVCSVDDNSVSLFSKDRFRLISKDGLLLYAKQNI